jgi:hypothetical protein
VRRRAGRRGGRRRRRRRRRRIRGGRRRFEQSRDVYVGMETDSVMGTATLTEHRIRLRSYSTSFFCMSFELRWEPIHRSSELSGCENCIASVSKGIMGLPHCFGVIAYGTGRRLSIYMALVLGFEDTPNRLQHEDALERKYPTLET